MEGECLKEEKKERKEGSVGRKTMTAVVECLLRVSVRPDRIDVC